MMRGLKNIDKELKKFCTRWDRAIREQVDQLFFDCAIDLRDWLVDHGYPREE